MKNKIFLLTLLVFFLCVQAGRAEDAVSVDVDLTFLDRNPFKSWLPKIEEKIEKTQEGTKIESKKLDGPLISETESSVKKPVVPEIEAPKFTINGLVWNTDRPQAIINGQIFAIGDIIEDSKIVDIHKDGIDVLFLNKLFTIQIEQTITQSI